VRLVKMKSESTRPNGNDAAASGATEQQP